MPRPSISSLSPDMVSNVALAEQQALDPGEVSGAALNCNGVTLGDQYFQEPSVQEAVMLAVAEVQRAAQDCLNEITRSMQVSISSHESALNGHLTSHQNHMDYHQSLLAQYNAFVHERPAGDHTTLERECQAADGKPEDGPGKVSNDDQEVRPVMSPSLSMKDLSKQAHALNIESFRKEISSVFSRGMSFEGVRSHWRSRPRWEGTRSFGSDLKAWAYWLVQSSWWNNFTCVVVMMNVLTIGIEINDRMQGKTSEHLKHVEHIFLIIYVIELCVTFKAYGLDCWKNGWVRLDAALILMGVCFSWIIEPVTQHNDSIGDPHGLELFKNLMIFRVLRLFRLARALRLANRFETLGKLVSGMLSSAGTMLSALALIITTLYILACVGAELIDMSPELKSHPEVGPIIEYRLCNIPLMMLSLVQFVTGDSISALYLPIVMAQPWSVIYFAIVIATLLFLLMNLVTAIVVEDALTRGAKDRDLVNAKKRRLMKANVPTIQKIFHILDKSGDGKIDFTEVLERFDEIRDHVPAEMTGISSPETLVDFFEYLDHDDSLTISEDEFVDGICHLALNSSVPIETAQIIQLLRSQRDQLYHIREEVEINSSNSRPSSRQSS